MPYKFLTKGLNFKQQSDTQYQGSIDLVLDESLKTLKQQYVADLQIEKDNLAGQLNQLKNELVTGIENDITEYNDTLGLTQKQQQIDAITNDLNTIDSNIERIGQKLQTTEELIDLFDEILFISRLFSFSSVSGLNNLFLIPKLNLEE